MVRQNRKPTKTDCLMDDTARVKLLHDILDHRYEVNINFLVDILVAEMGRLETLGLEPALSANLGRVAETTVISHVCDMLGGNMCTILDLVNQRCQDLMQGQHGGYTPAGPEV